MISALNMLSRLCLGEKKLPGLELWKNDGTNEFQFLFGHFFVVFFYIVLWLIVANLLGSYVTRESNPLVSPCHCTTTAGQQHGFQPSRACRLWLAVSAGRHRPNNAKWKWPTMAHNSIPMCLLHVWSRISDQRAKQHCVTLSQKCLCDLVSSPCEVCCDSRAHERTNSCMLLFVEGLSINIWSIQWIAMAS